MSAQGKTDPRVDAYLAKAPAYAKPILSQLRSAIHQACPEVSETIKWSRPFFLRGDAILCNLSAFKDYCSFGFWHPGMKPVLEKAGILSGKTMGSLGAIRSLNDLPPKAELIAILRKAAELAGDSAAKSVARVVKPAKPSIETPADFAAALKKNKAAASRFEAFSPSKRREYIEWIVDAKRDETRRKRIETAVAWIEEGKSRNWKYE